jgi:hypothetical protein
MIKKGVTFVVQGPLTEEGLRGIHNYKKLGDVIVSCWDFDPPHVIKKIPKGVKVIVNSFKEDNSYNFQNIKYQIESSLKGLLEVKTDFVVKVRSDEYFTKMNKFVSSVYFHPEKLTVCNFLFRKRALFHPSDHVFGGKVETLIKMFDNSKKMISCYKKDETVDIERLGFKKEYTKGQQFIFNRLTAEMTFCLCYLKVKGIDVISDIKNMDKEEVLDYHRRVMQNNYRLVRASELGHFLFRYKTNTEKGGPTAFTNEEDFLNYRIGSITSLEDL